MFIFWLHAILLRVLLVHIRLTDTFQLSAEKAGTNRYLTPPNIDSGG